MTRVRKKSFLLITFLGPIFFAAVCLLPAIIMNFTSEERKNIALVDESGVIQPRIQDTELIDFNDYTGYSVDSLKTQMGDIDIIVSVSPLDTATRSVNVAAYAAKPISVDMKSAIASQIDDAIEDYRLTLYDMDDLKQSVQNATYEQKDPLLIYKFESFNLFSKMLEELNQDVLSFLLRAFIPLRDASEAKAPAQQRKPDMSNMQTSRTDLVTNGGEAKSNMPVHVEKQVGRNDPCPCGSGKKFKNCHGKGL